MTVLLRRPALSATALLLLSAAPAFAQVTAQQVWDDWQAQMAAMGQALQPHLWARLKRA